MSPLSTLLTSLVALCLGPSLSAQGQVWVVKEGGGPGVDFTDIDPAVQAAASGDILLIHSGNYRAPVTIKSKSLVLLADDNATPMILNTSFLVGNLMPFQQVVIRGLHSKNTPWTVTSNLGSVWLEDCSMEGTGFGDVASIAATSCTNVVFIRCQVEGAIPFLGCCNSHGLFTMGSTVTVYDSQFEGGWGYAGPYAPDFPGADGIHARNSFLYLSNSTLTGGDSSKAGGHGLSLMGVSTVAYVHAVTANGGSGSPPGSGIDVNSATLHTLAGPARTFEIDAPARYGDTISLRFKGPAFEQVWLPHAVAAGANFQWNGMFLLDPSQLLMFRIGTIPANGVLNLNVTVPDLSPIAGIPFFSQGWFLGPGGLNLSSASMSVLLDPAH